ncbi:hypothetical protein D9757_005039 [Collybiopsis confluens]|uniref:Uncharacterized protein n=1 Tax=Collybiopsis confluens TaxID=2823264 RepID=A0A8H5HSY9_9AGAR|nr:hypothetical protein D9757_005039 [Collybiopsis confluens]
MISLCKIVRSFRRILGQLTLPRTKVYGTLCVYHRRTFSTCRTSPVDNTSYSRFQPSNIACSVVHCTLSNPTLASLLPISPSAKLVFTLRWLITDSDLPSCPLQISDPFVKYSSPFAFYNDDQVQAGTASAKPGFSPQQPIQSPPARLAALSRGDFAGSAGSAGSSGQQHLVLLMLPARTSSKADEYLTRKRKPNTSPTV